MPKYLVRARYSTDAVSGLLRDGGTARRAAVTKTIEKLGGSLEAFYYTFGEDDAVVILDMPNNVTVAALGLAVAAAGTGHVATTVLLTPEELDEAARTAVDYRPPGS